VGGHYYFGIYPQFSLWAISPGNDVLLMLPGPRVTLNTPSQAIDKIKTDRSGPFRVVGLQWNFMGDYSAVYELEDIRSCAPLSNGKFMDSFGLFRAWNSANIGRFGWLIRFKRNLC